MTTPLGGGRKSWYIIIIIICISVTHVPPYLYALTGEIKFIYLLFIYLVYIPWILETNTSWAFRAYVYRTVLVLTLVVSAWMNKTNNFKRKVLLKNLISKIFLITSCLFFFTLRNFHMNFWRFLFPMQEFFICHEWNITS